MRPATKADEFDFYRCHRCAKLITAPQLRKALETDGKPCPCGSQRFTATNMLWHEWFLPKVWYFAFLRARGVA